MQKRFRCDGIKKLTRSLHRKKRIAEIMTIFNQISSCLFST